MIKKTVLKGTLRYSAINYSMGTCQLNLEDIHSVDLASRQVPDDLEVEIVAYVPPTIKAPDDAEWIVSRGGSHYLMSKNRALAVVGATGSWKLLGDDGGSSQCWTSSGCVGKGIEAVTNKLAELKRNGYSYESST